MSLWPGMEKCIGQDGKIHLAEVKMHDCLQRCTRTVALRGPVPDRQIELIGGEARKCSICDQSYRANQQFRREHR